jgi:hypothetical protein
MLAPQQGSSAFTKPKIKIKIKFLKKGEDINQAQTQVL